MKPLGKKVVELKVMEDFLVITKRSFFKIVINHFSSILSLSFIDMHGKLLLYFIGNYNIPPTPKGDGIEMFLSKVRNYLPIRM